ncbi:MAG: 2,3-bisphosphoglycerate-independent phosphoglycerate mutase [Anaerolineales bacterium]|jgi:2,3-bisphosphoglycerate-independent phosphoglycerate mutase
MDRALLKKLVKREKSKIVLLVMDGLGGLPMKSAGQTELEAANTPNLDRLAAQSVCGLHQPIAPGVTPGSGPAHLALFGYDPLKYQVGRGVLSGLGIGFDLQANDVAARGNFCTVDEAGVVTDRRAGRIPTEKNQELCDLLRQKIDLPGVDVFIQPVKEYRFLLVLRGEGLSGELADTDPLEVGEKLLAPQALSDNAEKTAELVQKFVDQVGDILADHQPANMVLLRGFSKIPDWPQFEDTFGLRAAAIAAYPMYRGVAKLVGMDVLEMGTQFEEEVSTLEERWNDYDFFFLHMKPIDSAGEDGDYERKTQLIEQVDSFMPRLLELEPDVLLVTGDHSTPSLLKYHSWHPVPVMLWSRYCRADSVNSFGERACMSGGLGPRIPATDLMPLALANALRLDKFGA